MKKAIFFKKIAFREPAGARTQDPNIKSVVLYLLSYGFSAYRTERVFRFGGANVWNIFVLPKHLAKNMASVAL